VSLYHSILGHERALAALEKARRSGRVAHAYLFCGPEGVGKERVAFAFAAALNCQDLPQAPCGVCDGCLRVTKGTHPDVRLLASEEELVRRGVLEAEKGRAPSEQIRNAQLDEVADLFRHRPYLGRHKVLVVVDAERMNVNCQNRFLKTLEEPTPESVILLVTAHPELLLPTVRSRCQALAFGPFPRDQVAKVLVERHGLSGEQALALAAMSQGSLGRAGALAEGTELADRDERVPAMERAVAGDLEESLAVAEDFGEGAEGRERLRATLDLWELWLRDLLVLRLGAPRALLVNQDRIEALEREAATRPPRSLLRLLEGVRKTRTALTANANPRLAAEALLLGTRAT